LPDGAIEYDKFDEYGINGWVQNKTIFKCAKNIGNWLSHFVDVSRRWAFKMWWSRIFLSTL